MVEHGAEAILRIVVFERLLNGFGYRYPEGTAAVGILRKNRPARFGKGARRGNGAPAENLHHRFAVRLLLKRAPHHEHGAFKPENVARLRERRPPLARAGLGRHLFSSAPLVFECLRHRAVGLVRTRRADAFVFEIDFRGGSERLFEPAGAVERRRPPLAHYFADGLGDFDVALARHLLFD